MMHGQQNVKEM